MTRLLIFTSLLILSACNRMPTVIAITNESPDCQSVTIRMTEPVGDSFSYIQCDTVTLEKQLEIEIDIDRPCPLFIQELRKPGIYMMLENGKRYELVFDGTGFKVVNDIAQEKYGSIPPPLIENHLTTEARKYASAATYTELKDIISEKHNEEMSVFESLRREGKISRKLFKAIATERDIYWRSITANVAYCHFNSAGKLSEEDHLIWKSAFEDIDMNDPVLTASRYYRELAESCTEYLIFGDPDLDMEKLMAEVEAGRLHTLYIDNYKRILEGNNLEYMIADRLFNACFQKDYSKELIDIFEDFQEKFPESNYKEVLGNTLQPVVDFHSKAELRQSGIEIIEGSSKPESFEDLLSMFKGRKVYIDVWASWCAPCKEEFKHTARLHELLTEKGYEALYISIDNEKNDRKWREMLQGFGLKGRHIRADKGLLKDLYSLYGSESMAIPWNMIIDEEGRIDEKFAKRPSEIQPEDL